MKNILLKTSVRMSTIVQPGYSKNDIEKYKSIFSKMKKIKVNKGGNIVYM